MTKHRTKKQKHSKAAAQSSRSSRKRARSSAVERRTHRRIDTEDLWVTELHGDFAYSVKAGNISEGGIYLEKRLKTGNEPSTLRIHFKQGSFEALAQPIHDRISGADFGTGYYFLRMNPTDTRALRSLLGNLD